MPVSHRASYPLVAGGTLGLIGLTVGYVAPSSFDSTATAGPLTGIFLTGPLCAAVGAIVGVLSAARQMSVRRFLVLVGCLVVLSIATSLSLSLPEDRFEREVLESEILRCQSPTALIPAARARWATMSPLRSGWQEDIPRMLDTTDGVVLTVHIIRTKSMFTSRKPWSAGKIVTSGWHSANRTEEYFATFAGANCDAYRRRIRATYSLEWWESQVSPPDILPSFLGLQVLQPTADAAR
jgi:hypothetical protein